MCSDRASFVTGESFVVDGGAVDALTARTPSLAERTGARTFC